MFLFQTGAIKRERLETIKFWAEKFLFQTGAIKSEIEMQIEQKLENMFLFQTGAIKRLQERYLLGKYRSFYSKLVRLKVARDRRFLYINL